MIWSISVWCSASMTRRGSGGAWIVSVAAVQSATRPGVNLVVLGPLQATPCIGAHLRGLKHAHDEPSAAHLGHHGALIAAAGLDADPLDVVRSQPCQQPRVALRGIGEAPPFGGPCDRHVELVLAGINPGTHHVMLAHLYRPFLV